MNIVDSNPIEGVSKPLVSRDKAKKTPITGSEEHLSVFKEVTKIESVKSIVTRASKANEYDNIMANIQSNEGTRTRTSM